MSELAPLFNTRTDIDPPKTSARKKTFEVIERPKPEKIRVELNVEKWPAIWQPAKSRNKPQLRIFERELNLEDGNRVTARLEVSFNHLGTLTTEERKMYCALIKVWEDEDKPTAQVFFSARQLARILGKGWGTNVIESTTKSLRKLRTISLEWVNAYYDKTGRTFRERKPMNFLAELKIIEREEDGVVNAAKGYFRFDDSLLANLLENNTKPIPLSEIVSIKSDIALLLYGHLDLILANKNRFERRTAELFEDLGLQNAEYRHMYERKRTIEITMKELVGRRISTGIISSARVEKTQDRKDYKIIVEKKSVREYLASTDDETLESPARRQLREGNSAHERLDKQARELVCYFHKKFHDVDDHSPQSKELSQAVSLITKIGFSVARHVVDFGFEDAPRTKYHPVTFGGILQYESRAVAHYEQTRLSKERAQQRQLEEAAHERLLDDYDAYVTGAMQEYTVDPAHKAEIESLFEKNLADIRQQFPTWPSSLLESMVRRNMNGDLKRLIGILSFKEFAALRNNTPEQGDAQLDSSHQHQAAPAEMNVNPSTGVSNSEPTM
jgi:hypothetical protein